MASVTCDVGDLVRISAAFTNASSAAADPTAVTVEIREPDGTETTYTYGTDAEVVKDSTGNYHLDLSVDAPGEWHYRWTGMGTVQAVDEDVVRAQTSAFAP